MESKQWLVVRVMLMLLMIPTSWSFTNHHRCRLQPDPSLRLFQKQRTSLGLRSRLSMSTTATETSTVSSTLSSSESTSPPTDLYSPASDDGDDYDYDGDGDGVDTTTPSASASTTTESTVTNTKSTSTSSTSTIIPKRAFDLFSIILKNVITPAISILTKNGLPTNVDDWDKFWNMTIVIEEVVVEQNDEDDDEQQQKEQERYENDDVVHSIQNNDNDDSIIVTNENENNIGDDTIDDATTKKAVTTKEVKMTLAESVTYALEQMGPTYVKFGQALSSRPDIIPRSLALSLSSLQDQMIPFDTYVAKNIVYSELFNVTTTSSSSSNTGTGGENETTTTTTLQEFLDSFSTQPVAAASIGQVYSAHLHGRKVAVKVQRPGIRDTVNEDFHLLKQVMTLIESIPAIPKLQPQHQKRFISTDLTGAVEEFMSRILEELDYQNEAKNIQLFSSLYSHRRKTDLNDDNDNAAEEDNDDNKGKKKKQMRKKRNSENTISSRDEIQVVVPEVLMEYCTDSVLVMEWIDGTKLVDLQTKEAAQESLALLQQGISCTLSQLLDTGILHADPHGGNLLKVLETDEEDGTVTQRLGYVDFGLLSTVPPNVRDALVCAVTELVFSRNVTAVANLFGELRLIPEEILSDPTEREALSTTLNEALDQVLQYNDPATVTTSSSINDDDVQMMTTTSTFTATTRIPTLRFDKLLDALSRLVPRFRFQLPPYFLNNARALSTLEGMAREIDPTFNVMQVLYPYALRHLLSNPNGSIVVESTLQNILRSPESGLIDKYRVGKLIDDTVQLTGYTRSRIIRDILSTESGPRVARMFIVEQLRKRILFFGTRKNKLSLLKKKSTFLRL